MDQMIDQVCCHSLFEDIWVINVMNQTRDAIKIAHRLFPNAVIHWIFDNSSCHGSLAKDALSATKLNIGPGGKNVPNMHDTVIPHDNPFRRGGLVQKMQFDDSLPSNHPFKEFEGKPKGIRVILEEHGYFQGGKKLVGDCKDCRQARSHKPHLTDHTKEELQLAEGDDPNDSEEEDERPPDCCLCRILALQSDFVAEKSMLQLVSSRHVEMTHSHADELPDHRRSRRCVSLLT